VLVFAQAAVAFTVIPSSPDVGRWMSLGQGRIPLFQMGPSLGLDGNLLPVPVAGLALLAYRAVGVLALHIAPRRDVP
jgi:hypothetical protein